MDERILEAFHSTARLNRSEVFSDERLMPITAVKDANTPAPGWVGKNWQGGTLLVGINPGGGGDSYRRNPTDDELYALLREFRSAGSTEAKATAFSKLSEAWIRIQKGHNIWRVIDQIIAATGERPDEVAFMNILPFRTRMDKAATTAELRNAFAKSSGPQIEALNPARIIALGKKAWDVLTKMPLAQGSDLILFKRGIGDSYIPEDSQLVLQRLAQERSKKD